MREDVNLVIEHFKKLYNVDQNLSISEQINKRRNIVENYGSIDGNKPEIDKNISIKKVKAHGVNCEWIVAPDADEDQRLLYIHGGAFFAGSLESHRAVCCEISKRSKIGVLNVDYRLAPEHPFPLGLDDCYDAYQWLLNNIPDKKSKAKSIFVEGDSAGGNLSIALAIKLKYSHIKMPNAILAISPVLDFTGKSESIKRLDGKDPVINKKALLQGLPLVYIFGNDLINIEKSPINKARLLSKAILTKKRLSKNQLISPIYADLRGLPPIMINVGENELLLDDSVRFAEKAKKSGVDITLKVWKDMMHVFTAFLGYLPEAEECFNDMSEFIYKHKSK